MNGPTRRLRFLVIGPASFLRERTRLFWSDACIDLIGPVAATNLAAFIPDGDMDGAIIDVRYEADVLLSILDTLQARRIAALFASPMSLSAYLTGGFVLSRNKEDMMAIINQLIGDNPPTFH